MLLLIIVGCATGIVQAVADFPFRNISLSWEDRVDDLVNRLTLQEKVNQMAFGGGGSGKPVPAIQRLGIGPYQFDTECLHGVTGMKSTAFPQAIGLSASFSKEVVYVLAEAIATEARAINNDAVKHAQYGPMTGISCFAPFINIARHPLWGRVQEVYSEDPFLSGLLAAAYVKGLHGRHPRYLRANSGCKVVGLYSGPEDLPVDRFSFNGIASERDLRLSYFPQFKACIDAGTLNLMCSFYSLNGIPGCTHKWLLTDVMRKEYGFKGYYVTDWGAIDFAFTAHHYYNSTVEAAAGAANAGVNLELPQSPSPAYLQLTAAVQKGLVAEATVTELVKPLFYARMRLGEFDPPELNPYLSIPLSVIESEEHRELAVLAAMKTFVLLKNDDGLLPLKSKVQTLAILGPMADNLDDLYGNYAPVVMPQYGKTPRQGLQSLATTLEYASGCDNIQCKKYNDTDIRKYSASADLVVVCLGTNYNYEGEGIDRPNLALPGYQEQLLADVLETAKRPIILLLFTGGPYDISVSKSSVRVGAIVHCFFPGQATGEALRRILAVDTSGEVNSPAGRSPYTWPKSIEQVPPMVNYSMEGRTYRYFKGPGQPLYPFGYGLSYVKFSYSNLAVNPTTVKAGDNVVVNVTVTNSGPYNSDEVVQVYISWRNCPVLMPQLQLVAVDRLMTKANQPLMVSLTISAEQMRVWDDNKGFTYISGFIDVYVGGQQPNQETSTGSNVLQGQFQVIA